MSEINTDTIEVKYKGEMDEKTDKVIISLFEGIGFKMVGAGYHLVKEERDIEFKRKN